MNTKLEYQILCDEVIIADNKKISIIGIFEIINVTELPAIHPKIAVVSKIRTTPGQHNFKLEIISPKMNKLIEAKNDFRVEESGYHNLVTNFFNLLIEDTGHYFVKLTIDNNELITNEEVHSFLVKKP